MYVECRKIFLMRLGSELLEFWHSVSRSEAVLDSVYSCFVVRFNTASWLLTYFKVILFDTFLTLSFDLI